MREKRGERKDGIKAGEVERQRDGGKDAPWLPYQFMCSIKTHLSLIWPSSSHSKGDILRMEQF